jgi:hypothetical protein
MSIIPQPDLRTDHKNRVVMNFAIELARESGRLRATDYALRNGAPGHVVKRLLHDRRPA